MSGRLADVQSAPSPEPIHLIGDSHVLPMRNLALAGVDGARRWIAVVRYVRALSAARFVNDQNSLDVEVTAAMRAAGMLDVEGVPQHRARHIQSFLESYAEGRSEIAPLLAFSCGEIDVRFKAMLPMGRQFDVVLPFETPYAVERDCQIAPFDSIRDLLATQFRPLQRGLDALVNNGFSRTYVLAIPPPTTDPGMVARYHGVAVPTDVRYKLATLGNLLLREACEAAGARFVDTWRELTGDGAYLDPRFDLDGFHLTRDGCLLVLRRLLAIDRDAPALANPTRWEVLLEYARDASRAPGPDFAQTGMTVVEVGDATPADLDRPEPEASPAADAGETWCEDPLPSGLDAGVLPPAALASLHSLLFDSAAGAALRAAAGCELLCFGARIVHRRGEPGAPVPVTVPPGVLRGVLAGASPEPFVELVSRSDGAAKALPPGTLTLWDPARHQRRVAAHAGPGARWVELALGPRLPAQPPLTLSSARAAWPVDPMCFPLPPSTRAWPAQATARVIAPILALMLARRDRQQA